MIEENAEERRAPDEWSRVHHTPRWLHVATVHHYRWPIGLALTEREYADACAAVGSIQLRSGDKAPTKPKTPSKRSATR